MTIKVLIVDDHAVVRQGLRLLLEPQPDITVVGEAADGRMALQLIETLQPSVVLLDLLMGEVNGLTVLKELQGSSHPPAVIVLTSSLEDQLVKQALAYGAMGYLLKTSRSSEVIAAIEQVAIGRPVLDPDATRVMIRQTQTNDLLDRLTGREREVFDLMALGRNVAEVSAALNVSEATVRTHTASMLEKLDLRDRVQIMAYALKRGLVRTDQL